MAAVHRRPLRRAALRIGCRHRFLWPGKLLLALLALSLFYHLGNGIRHRVWDTARGLTMPAIRASAVWVLAAAVVLTLLVLLV
ncbi:MAG: hypothetical protein M5U09_00700 [Gammaproteobacteria bacterium]|nr:hypothetical protein [Gammaproteobacteria bacterium]